MSSSSNRPGEGVPNYQNVDETIDLGSDSSAAPLTTPGEESTPLPDSLGTSAKTFGHYTLLEEIARGGMGVVYKARDDKLGRIVALKMIISGKFASESDVRRFYLEAESAANLDHEGIVPIYEIGQVDGNHFFSMKLIEGGSLSERFPEIRADERAAVELIAKVARAVHHAHQRGILHRDIKPGNILLDSDGSPMVSDLGLAKDTTNDSGLTHTGAVVGTPGYMSPEQASGIEEITTAADIYAIGAILYESMTGQPPHKGSTVVDTLRKVVEEEPVQPRSINGKINRTLQLICLTCLKKDPNQRYASAAELAQDLESWLNGDSVSVRPTSWSSTIGEVVLLHLRSVVGAAIIGIVAGWVAGYCLANLSISSSVLRNPPATIYAEMGMPAPFGMSLIPVNTKAVFEERQHSSNQKWCVVGLYFAIVVAGIVVASVTRPRTSNGAFAIGAVSALLMTFVFFVQTLFMSVQSTLYDTSFANLEALANVAVAGDAELEESRSALSKRFPELENIPAERRASTLANYLNYQTVFATPIPILVGIGIASIFCLAPCTFGTTYTSKLITQKLPWWKWVPLSLEFGYLITIACAMVFLITILGVIPESTGPVELSIGRQVFTYAILLTLIVGMYRQKLRWYWRLVLYIVFWLGILISA